MKVLVRPARFRNREDRDQARALLARRVLFELIVAAKSQVGPLRWANEGGLELEDFAICLDSGRWHPLLKEWQGKRKTASGHPVPSARELQAQWYMCLATVALERAISLGPGEAREIVARKAARLFDKPPTAKTIEHWQDKQPPLSAAGEQMLATAINRSRVHEPGGRERLVDYFIGLAHAVLTPGTQITE